MKIKGNVISVQDCGDVMEVTVQGAEASSPDWNKSHRQVFRIQATARNKRSYWIGREVEMKVSPR